MNPFRKVAILGIFLALGSAVLPAGADELFVKNRPFEGLVIPAGGKLWVELEPFCQALNVQFERSAAGGYILFDSSANNVPKYSVQAGEVVIRGDQVQGKLLVPLKAVANAVKARVVRNKGLETIDVNLDR